MRAIEEYIKWENDQYLKNKDWGKIAHNGCGFVGEF
jgi:hypothetical protein